MEKLKFRVLIFRPNSEQKKHPKQLQQKQQQQQLKIKIGNFERPSESNTQHGLKVVKKIEDNFYPTSFPESLVYPQTRLIFTLL